MEFWGVEVTAGEKLKVRPEFGQLIHISQASLGEVKDGKGTKNIPLRMKIDDKNFIIGTLAAEHRTQIMFDLVFEKEFELSHDWKNGSVYFLGYIAEDPASGGEEFSDDDESEEELVLEAPSNGVAKAKSGHVKPAQKAVPVAAKAGANDKAKKAEPESDDDDDDDEDDSEFDSDDEMAIDGLPQVDSSDEDGSDDEDESDEEEPPKVVQQSKKRPAGSAEKTPNAKKAKAATPEKSGKKGQNATPAPSKSAGKTPNKVQTPKAGEISSCNSCLKTFSSDGALQSHNKAKHGGK